MRSFQSAMNYMPDSTKIMIISLLLGAAVVGGLWWAVG